MGTLAWHFIGDTLLNGDPVPEDGEPLRFFDEIVWCESGLYASPRVLNALEYAPGSTLCRVTCDHIQKEEWDKFVCRERTILKRADILPALEEFSRWCALECAHVWEAPETVKDYLRTGYPNDRFMAQSLIPGSEPCEYNPFNLAREASLYATHFFSAETAANAAYFTRRALINFGQFDEEKNYEWQETKLLKLIKKSFDFSVT